jgi:hypothetical protein
MTSRSIMWRFIEEFHAQLNLAVADELKQLGPPLLVFLPRSKICVMIGVGKLQQFRVQIDLCACKSDRDRAGLFR